MVFIVTVELLLCPLLSTTTILTVIVIFKLSSRYSYRRRRVVALDFILVNLL